MFRAIPVSNKLIEKKSFERSLEKHQRKLQEMKPYIPDRPETFLHMKRNKKKELLVEERFTEIERCNRLLLERLTTIMKKPSKNGGNGQHQFRVKSLNRDSRKRELVKITIENQEILKRIQTRKSEYSVHDWLESHKQKQNYLKNISEYPIKLYSNNTSRMDGSFADYRTDPLRDNSYGRPRTYEANKSFRALTPNSYLNNLSFDEPRMRPSTNHRSFRTRTYEQLLTNEESRRDNLAPFEPSNSVIPPKKILYQARKQYGAGMYSVQFYMQNK